MPWPKPLENAPPGISLSVAHLYETSDKETRAHKKSLRNQGRDLRMCIPQGVRTTQPKSVQRIRRVQPVENALMLGKQNTPRTMSSVQPQCEENENDEQKNDERKNGNPPSSCPATKKRMHLGQRYQQETQNKHPVSGKLLSSFPASHILSCIPMIVLSS